MSGIAGIIHFDGAPVEPGLIEKMTTAMSHRGPDGTHFWQADSVAFGHCMLQTTTESLEETQPWLSEDGRYVLVMDGRLDNWEELRNQLELQGCRLRNRSDAELVIQAFQLWGIDCLKHIEGDFAFVIWDTRDKKLHCIRDRMGSKPFHYHWNGKTLSFASELRALFQLPWIPKICNEDMLVDYFMAQWCTKDETLWKDIWRLPQAHRLEIDAGNFRLSQYWQPELNELLNFETDAEYAECYRSLLIEAVRRSSRSHKSVAFEVSGGLDSSALFAVADHLEKTSKLAAPAIEGYTLDFHDDEAANELVYAEAVGLHLDRCIHKISPMQPSLEWYVGWGKDYCEIPPYPNSSMAIGIREQSRLNGSKALLVGVGGDEWLFAGRSYYTEEIRARRWGAFARCWAADKRDFGTVQSLWWVARLGLVTMLPQQLKHAVRAQFSEKHPFGNTDMSWLSPRMRAKACARRHDLYACTPGKFGNFSQISKWNMAFSPVIASAREAEERLAASYGLELRWPFFNLQLAQFAFASPDRSRLRGGMDKFVHRQAMARLLPTSVLNRKTKADFMVTYRRYLQGMDNQYCKEIPSRRLDWIDAKRLSEVFLATKEGATTNGMPEWQLWGLFGCDAISV